MVRINYDFPFKSLPVKTGLRRLFKAARYDASDLQSIRGDVYYSDLHVNERGSYCFTQSIPTAIRDQDGTFSVFISRVRVVDDRINGVICLNAGERAGVGENITCTQDQVIETLQAMERDLRARGHVQASYPHEAVSSYEIGSSLHWNIARALFEYPMTRYQITYQILLEKGRKPVLSLDPSC